MRSTIGSSAVLTNNARSPSSARRSSTLRSAPTSACGSPSAANTIANGSSCTCACAAICAASSRCGSPPTENTGSFWPRTSVASPSIALTPVRIASVGAARRAGSIGAPAIARGSPPSTGGPPSSGSPRPLQMRPSHSSPTAICIGVPPNATRAESRRMPEVPSNTSTTARSRATSSTVPCLISPESSVICATSSQPTPLTSCTTISGPRMEPTARYSIGAGALTRPAPTPRSAARRGAAPRPRRRDRCRSARAARLRDRWRPAARRRHRG